MILLLADQWWLKIHYKNHLEHHSRENKKMTNKQTTGMLILVWGIALNEHFHDYSYPTIRSKQYKIDDSLIPHRWKILFWKSTLLKI